MLSEKLIGFYKQLEPPVNLPKGIELLFPQKNAQVIEIVETFFKKYFNDDNPRGLMLGINPGRYGAGITGVNFTAPKQLKECCGIDHPFKTSSELSAEFIYDVIASYGSAEKFYSKWFIGSVCPLGFVTSSVPTYDGTPSPSEKEKGGKNVNYYDDKRLLEAVTTFIIDCINKQIKLGFKTEKCICVGGEKNFKFLSALNSEHKWFGDIIPLPHPRFILQYRRKQKDNYIHQYLSALELAS